MLQLLDGPCKGAYLVKRAPTYLRAVINTKKETDVLDQVDDTPAESEKVYIYEREGGTGWVHLNSTKTKGYYAMATYHHLPDVDGEALRNNAA